MNQKERAKLAKLHKFFKKHSLKYIFSLSYEDDEKEVTDIFMCDCGKFLVKDQDGWEEPNDYAPQFIVDSLAIIPPKYRSLWKKALQESGNEVPHSWVPTKKRAHDSNVYHINVDELEEDD